MAIIVHKSISEAKDVAKVVRRLGPKFEARGTAVYYAKRTLWERVKEVLGATMYLPIARIDVDGKTAATTNRFVAKKLDKMGFSVVLRASLDEWQYYYE